MQRAFAPSVHSLQLLKEDSLWFSQCQAHFIKAAGLKTKSRPDFQPHLAYCLPPARRYGHGDELRRFRSGALKQSLLPPKAHIGILLEVFLKGGSRHRFLTSHSNTCAPKQPENTQNCSITDHYGGFVSDWPAAFTAKSHIKTLRPGTWWELENLSFPHLDLCLLQNLITEQFRLGHY